VGRNCLNPEVIDMARSAKSRRQLSNKAMAVVAMLQSGYDDLGLIADSLGMTINEVEAIESAEDQRVRRLLREGLPQGFLYRIHRAVKCRICGGKINLVPCVLCR
jgi:hypothetical protein